ncbi:carbohydrate ABC transporter permease [Martelella endophytica]|uniref:ABC transporter permease n=1 Tax=Martelella endophytica TaxID=1486262 RepID=A0A0D5LU27_MAREN|nr:sugar ABC transporter permease [Martelella endophytica]AJY47470.1 ABC transporter permease [Martelella endophytica]
MRTRTSLLGLAFLTPTLVLLILFFIMPVVFTAYFSFTNMSTSTGIGRGEYMLTDTLLRRLKSEGLSQADVDAVSRETFTVDAAGHDTAIAAGVDKRFADDILDNFAGQSFSDARDFERALRGLRSAPRSPRAVKEAARAFTHSALNTRYRTPDELSAVLTAVAPEVEEETRDLIVHRSYTGHVLTTDNFRKLASAPDTLQLIGNTVLYVGLTLAFFNVSLGLFLAILMFYLPKRASGIFSALWLLPRITPMVLYAVLWKWFTWDSGFLPTLAAHLGLPSFNYMKGSIVTAWITMICSNGFVGASFGMLLFSGALRSIPIQQIWASEVDGANRWQQVRRIILPQMRWPILFVTSYQTLSLIASYELIWLTTNGGPGSSTTVWSLSAFKTALFNYTGNLQYGLGAAMALVLVVIGLVASIFYLRLFKFNELLTKPRIEF